jgi:hypothetical protein
LIAGSPSTLQEHQLLGCAVKTRDPGITTLANVMEWYRIRDEYFKTHFQNYTDPDGQQYAIVGPPKAAEEVDWKASSFAVATQCTVIPVTACDIQYFDITRIESGSWGIFNCTKTGGSPIDFTGNLTAAIMGNHFLASHKYLYQDLPFWDNTLDMKTTKGSRAHQILYATDQDAQSMWLNPWTWVAQATIFVEDDAPEDMKSTAWSSRFQNIIVPYCNSTGKLP